LEAEDDGFRVTELSERRGGKQWMLFYFFTGAGLNEHNKGRALSYAGPTLRFLGAFTTPNALKVAKTKFLHPSLPNVRV
jgi:hypothetical protein